MKKVGLWILVIVATFAIFFGALYLIDVNKIKNNEDDRNLTLEVIKSMVADKGDKLTWSDFEKYKSRDVGSGLYILLYEIDENFNLMIGGVPSTEPMYIRLVSQKDNDQYIDIRYDDIDEFLNEINFINDISSQGQSFIGTVLEETTTYMIVEPNEDEDERKSSDKIRINYSTDHLDYLYGVGRKVLITYSGYIMETYPAQINTNNIGTQGYPDFELVPEKAEGITKKKILNNKELYENNSDFDLYYYGLENVKVKVTNKTMSLEEALRSGKITIDGIIAKANRDVKETEEKYAKYEDGQSVPRLLPYSDIYKDGGSTIYYYDTYTILKKHSLDGDRDVYIGSPELTMDDIMVKR